MTRTIIAIGISMVLSFAFLAACNGDADDEVDDIDDQPIGAADDEEEGPIEDDVAFEDDDVVLDEHEDEAVEEEDDDAINGTADDAEISDDHAAVTGEADDAVVDELDDDEGAVGRDDEIVADEDDAVTDDLDDTVTEDADFADAPTIEVVLTDHEIEIESTIESGPVVLEVTNDGDSLHGIAIQEAAFNGDDDENGEGAAGAYVASITIAAGETETREIELAEGEYIVFCPVGEHRDEHDMETELTAE